MQPFMKVWPQNMITCPDYPRSNFNRERVYSKHVRFGKQLFWIKLWKTSGDTSSSDEILITGLYDNDPEYTETDLKVQNSGSSSECSDSDENTQIQAA